MSSVAKEPVTEVIPLITCISLVSESPKLALPSTVISPSTSTLPEKSALEPVKFLSESITIVSLIEYSFASTVPEKSALEPVTFLSESITIVSLIEYSLASALPVTSKLEADTYPEK